jgi:hypothetical protein
LQPWATEVPQLFNCHWPSPVTRPYYSTKTSYAGI